MNSASNPATTPADVISDEPAAPDGTVSRIEERPSGPTIQPHGLLMVLAELDLTIEYMSENLESLVGIPAREVCGAALDALLTESDARAFAEQLRETQLAALNPVELKLIGPHARERTFEATVQRRECGGFIVELEPAAVLERPAFTDILRPIKRLQTAPDDATLLADAATDLQSLSGFDRVLIFQVGADWSGAVVAEATGPGITAGYAGRHVPAGDMPESSRAAYVRNMLRIIPDTNYCAARLVRAPQLTNAAPVDLSRSTLRSAPAHQLASLKSMGSGAALTISIVVRGKIWGVVAFHHTAPRYLNYAKRALCELLAHLLTWQLGSRLDAEERRKSARNAVLAAQIEAKLESDDDLIAALIGGAPDLYEMFAADGFALRIDGAIARSGNVRVSDVSIAAIAGTLFRADTADVTVANDRLTSLVPELRELPGAPAGALGMRLSERGKDVLLLFRDETVRTIGWAARPGAQPWDEVVHDFSTAWTPADFAAAGMLAPRIIGRLQHLTALRAEQIAHVNAHLAERNAQAEALIRLQEDVAAALPSRTAVIDIVLDFAVCHTTANGSVLERLSGSDIVYEAACGSLAPQTGLRVESARSLSQLCTDLDQTLVCDDTSTDVEAVDRDVCRRLNVGSMVVVPIAVSPTDRFVLKVVSERTWAFSAGHTQMLKLAATNLLSALRAAQKFTAIAAAEFEQRTYARQLRALHAIASTTTSHRKEQIVAALQLGLEQIGLDWAYLGVIDYATSEFVIESSVSADGGAAIADGTRMPLGTTVIGQVALSKSVIAVEDVARLPGPVRASAWKAYIAVPLFIAQENYGAIGFAARAARAEPFSEANIEFLAVAGEIIASAIERGLQREELENSQTRHSALIEAIPQMMWVIDADDTFEYVNDRWTRYTGLTLEQSRATGRDGVYHAADFAAAVSGRSSRATEFDYEVRLRRADGAYRWHLVRSMPYRRNAGGAGKWLVTATDIEARKSAEALLADVHDAALAATEAKSRFLATMSHEIRTPMNGVIGMTELLLLTPLNDEQREYTEIIRDSGQSLLRVLNDILDYSKIEAGKLELENVEFDLPGQVESVVELLRPGFIGKGVRLTTHIDPDVRTGVVGDPGRLRQILLNLAGNALKFTAAGGDVRIVVSTSPTAQADISPVRVTIEDTGIGIPADVIERLFVPFSQGDESTTRKFGGTGLGLSISAELVTLMGGQIGVESEAEIGSRFWFFIPFRLAPNSQKVADARMRLLPRNEPAPLRAERILLVEDNEINTFLALKQLQRLGFAVTSVTNGRQAVDAVHRERYDLLLMDCHMPEMDGFEATRAIRNLETGSAPHIPIVAMTADARDEDHQNCLLAGMDDYISKPTNLDSLKAVLDRWLPAPERRRASRNGATPYNSAPTLGMSMLLELFNGDRGAVLALLAAALGAINADVKRIEAAAAARDFETVVEAAHRLKGTSGSIRSGRLVEIGAAIETEARTSPAMVSPTLLAELRAAVAAVTAEVQQQKKSADPTSAR